MPRKRRYQRGGSDAPQPSVTGNSDGPIVKLIKKNKKSLLIALRVVVALVVVALVVVAVVFLVNRDDPSSEGDDPPIYSGPKRTMRQVLNNCQVDLNVDEIDIDSANTCIKIYLKSGNFNSYKDVYDSNLFKGVTDFITNEKLSLLKDSIVNAGGETMNNAMKKLIGTIENYDGSSSVLCLNNSVTECPLSKKTDQAEINQANAISDILQNIHTCVTSNVSCDNIIPEDPHDYVTDHDEYSRIRALKEIFLYGE